MRKWFDDRRREGGALPGLVLSSSAARALETAELILAALGDDVELVAEDGLYRADPDDVMERLRLVDDSYRSVMVVGHNPTVAELVVEMCADKEDEPEDFPTCALAVLSVGAGTWENLAYRSARLVDLYVPEAR